MINSPCIRECEWDKETLTCIGCLRTIDELRNWRKMSDDEKQSVLDRIDEVKNCHSKQNLNQELKKG